MTDAKHNKKARWIQIGVSAVLATGLMLRSPLSQTAPRSDPPPYSISPKDAVVKLEGKKYNLLRREDLRAFSNAIGVIDARNRPKSGVVLAASESPAKKLPKKDRRGLRTMKRIADEILNGKENETEGLKTILEIDWAIKSNTQKPHVWKSSLDLIAAVGRVRDVTLNAVGRGSSTDPARDLATNKSSDLSTADPLPSSFWSRPVSIAKADLYHGFGRTELPEYASAEFQYDSPHDGYGGHPGFDVRWKDARWKVKFGEQHTEPFGTRIFWALGFPALVTEYAPHIKVTWDRRILLDFNDHKSNAMNIKAAGVTLFRKEKRPYYDPFDYIDGAILKDRTRVASGELRSRLFRRPKSGKLPKHPEQQTDLYDRGFESDIAYLITKEVNLRPRDAGPGADNLGSWDYNYLDHPKRRELRGMCVLDAWIDNWDVRWGNTKLQLVKGDDDKPTLRHVVSDLGGILGDSSGLFRFHQGRFHNGLIPDKPNSFSWTFTAPLKPGQDSVPIKFYMPITKVAPFYQMNIDDARWMARIISELTENQIKQALVAANYDAAWSRLLLEKLVSRRDQMIKDFGLPIAPLRPNGIDRKLNYDPRADAPFEAVLPDGRKVAASVTRQFVISNGILMTVNGKKV